MEDVGRMWQRQARLGISELERAAERKSCIDCDYEICKLISSEIR